MSCTSFLLYKIAALVLPEIKLLAMYLLSYYFLLVCVFWEGVILLFWSALNSRFPSFSLPKHWDLQGNTYNHGQLFKQLVCFKSAADHDWPDAWNGSEQTQGVGHLTVRVINRMSQPGSVAGDQQQLPAHLETWGRFCQSREMNQHPEGRASYPTPIPDQWVT